MRTNTVIGMRMGMGLGMRKGTGIRMRAEMRIWVIIGISIGICIGMGIGKKCFVSIADQSTQLKPNTFFDDRFLAPYFIKTHFI